MQWTRASERLPDNEWSNGGYYDHIDDTFQPCVIRHDKGLGITITFPNGADIENPDLTKLRWLNDESPESSVWPGEQEIWTAAREEANKFEDKYRVRPDDFLKIFTSAVRWFQSRTAVKAEKKPKRIWNPKLTVPDQQQWQEMSRDEKDGYYIDESQPTAGGVYPSVNTSYSENVKALGRKHSKEFEKILEEKSQPSPSNPSIKRPTEEEYTKAYDIWEKENPGPGMEFIAWKAAINWFLSLQSDKT